MVGCVMCDWVWVRWRVAGEHGATNTRARTEMVAGFRERSADEDETVKDGWVDVGEIDISVNLAFQGSNDDRVDNR